MHTHMHTQCIHTLGSPYTEFTKCHLETLAHLNLCYQIGSNVVRAKSLDVIKTGLRYGYHPLVDRTAACLDVTLMTLCEPWLNSTVPDKSLVAWVQIHLKCPSNIFLINIFLQEMAHFNPNSFWNNVLVQNKTVEKYSNVHSLVKAHWVNFCKDKSPCSLVLWCTQSWIRASPVTNNWSDQFLGVYKNNPSTPDLHINFNLTSDNMPKIHPETKVLIIKRLKTRSTAEVADTFNVSQRQVQRIRKRYEETGDIFDKPRSGRPCKTTAREDRLLARKSKASPFSTAAELHET